MKRSGKEGEGGWTLVIFLPASALQTCTHQMAQQHGPEQSKCSSALYFCRSVQILLFILNLQQFYGQHKLGCAYHIT